MAELSFQSSVGVITNPYFVGSILILENIGKQIEKHLITNDKSFCVLLHCLPMCLLYISVKALLFDEQWIDFAVSWIHVFNF